MSNFRVGQRVACINDEWRHPLIAILRPELPKKGRVYTIAGFNEIGNLQIEGFLAWRWFWMTIDVYFARDHFRPLIERKTDISIFTAMLDKAPKREMADA